MLNEQIASVVFSCLPEDGPLAVILDGNGKYWSSNTEKYSAIFSKGHSLEDIISRINDGDDPVIGNVDGTAVVASELSTKNAHCGYVVFALDGYTQESAVENIDLIDTIISLMSLVGCLIERNDQIKTDQSKKSYFSRYNEACPN